eukprot:22257-Eustigmatos_ZCMA.PRE.1
MKHHDLACSFTELENVVVSVSMGYDVPQGMLHIRGQYGLMVDADGATDITCLERLYDCTKKVNGRDWSALSQMGLEIITYRPSRSQVTSR